MKKLKEKVQIVVLAENQVLLLQFATLYNKGFQNITGSVEANESFHEAAVRELEEETQLKSPLIKIEQENNFIDRFGFQVTEAIFYTHFEKIPEIKISEEHCSFKWIPFAMINESDYVFPSNLQATQTAIKIVQKNEN